MMPTQSSLVDKTRRVEKTVEKKNFVKRRQTFCKEDLFSATNAKENAALDRLCLLPEAIRCGIFDSFFRDNFRPEVVSDVISGVVLMTFLLNWVILCQTVLELNESLTL